MSFGNSFNQKNNINKEHSKGFSEEKEFEKKDNFRNQAKGGEEEKKEESKNEYVNKNNQN